MTMQEISLKCRTKSPLASAPSVGSSEWLGELEAAIGKLRSAYSLHWQRMTGDQIADMECAIESVQNVIDTERNTVEYHVGTQQLNMKMEYVKKLFLVRCGGGTGPNVWEAKEEVVADNIRQALDHAEIKLQSTNGVIFGIEQVD